MSQRSGWSEQERHLRSRLTQIITQKGLVRGNLVLTARTCGKPGCRCQRGQRHECWYLGFGEQGTTKMIFVPKEWEPRVRSWVDDYHELLRLLEELSRLYLERLRQRKD